MEMNCALVQQVDAHPDSALEDTYSGLQSLLTIDNTTLIFCVFSLFIFFSWRVAVFYPKQTQSLIFLD